MVDLSVEPASVDLLLLVHEHAWHGEELGQPTSPIYPILADTLPSVSAAGSAPCLRFRLNGTGANVLLARVPIGPLHAALVAREMLQQHRPRIMALIGFGGILSDDLRLGDVAIASQVDCYLTKNKAAPSKAGEPDGGVATEISFAGEVYRPSQSFVRTALNLKYAHPGIYEMFQAGVRSSARRAGLLTKDQAARCYVRGADAPGPQMEGALVHGVHFASAELVSASAEALRWLRSRDRKVGVVDMEGGGVLAAAHDYASSTRALVETLILRGMGGYGDDRHENLVKPNAQAIQAYGFENACRFLVALMQALDRTPPAMSESEGVEVGIVIPLEEEFGYFAGLLRDVGTEVSAEPRLCGGRVYYLFSRGGVRCAATFVGDMGLVQMGLATQDLRRDLSPAMIVLIGIAAGFAGPEDLHVCDVAIASEIDLYMHRARLPARRGNFVNLAVSREIKATESLARFAATDIAFEAARNEWARACNEDLGRALQEEGVAKAGDLAEFRIQMRPRAFSVRLASGDLVAATEEFTQALAGRGCSAVDMEAGGAVVACDPTPHWPTPQLLVLRGISDSGDERKAELERQVTPNFFRRACMRNVSRFLATLLDHPGFASLVRSRS